MSGELKVNENVVKDQLKNEFVEPGEEAMGNLFAQIPKRDEGKVDGLDDDDGKKDDEPNPPKGDDDDSLKDKKKEEKKDEKKDDDDDEIEDAVLGTLQTEFGELEGLEIEEDDDDLDKMKKYISKRDEVLIPKTKKEGVLELFEQLPVVKDLVEHLVAGYGVESFRAQIQQDAEYKMIDIESADDAVLEKIYRDSLKARGTEEEEIEELVETAKDNGKLKDRSKKGQDYLKSQSDKKIEERKLIEKAESDQQKKDEKEFVDTITSFVKDQKIGNIKLTAEQTKTFESHMFGVTTEGKSVRDVRWSQLTPEKLALLDYIIASDFKDLGLKEDNSEKTKKKYVINKKKDDATTKVDLKTRSASIDVKSLFS